VKIGPTYPEIIVRKKSLKIKKKEINASKTYACWACMPGKLSQLIVTELANFAEIYI